MKGTYLKNLTVAPDAPVPSTPRSSKPQPPTRGLLPAAAQLAARQLLGHWAGQREERMQSAPRQQQETSDSIRSWAKSALESLERGSTALRQICSKYRVCWAPALWHSHSDSDPRIQLVYLMGLLKQQIYKHISFRRKHLSFHQNPCRNYISLSNTNQTLVWWRFGHREQLLKPHQIPKLAFSNFRS